MMDKLNTKDDIEFISQLHIRTDEIYQKIASINIEKIALAISFNHTDIKTKEQIKLQSASELDKYIFTEKIRLKGMEQELLVKLDYYNVKKVTIANNLEKTKTHLIPQSKENQTYWSKIDTIKILIMLLGLILLSYIEINFTIDVFSNSIPYFEKNPSGAIILGLIPIFLGIIIDMIIYLTRKFNITYKYLAMIALLILFILFHLVIYQIQTEKPIDLENVFNEASIKEGYFVLDYHALYYSVASTIISIFVFLIAYFFVQIIDKIKPPLKENPEWKILDENYKYIIDILGKINSGLVLVRSIEEVVDAFTPSLEHILLHKQEDVINQHTEKLEKREKIESAIKEKREELIKHFNEKQKYTAIVSYKDKKQKIYEELDNEYKIVQKEQYDLYDKPIADISNEINELEENLKGI